MLLQSDDPSLFFGREAIQALACLLVRGALFGWHDRQAIDDC
jgi:hypothetical protein